MKRSTSRDWSDRKTILSVDEVPKTKEMTSAAPSSDARPRHRDPQLVLVYQRRERTPPQPSRPCRQGFTVFYRTQRLRQEHNRQHPALEAARARRPPHHAPQRRPRAQEPLERARFSKEHRNINIKRIGYVAAESQTAASPCAPDRPV